MNNNGDVITEDDKEYVCVQDLLTESSIKPPEVMLSFKKEALNAVVTSMKETIHHNYMGGIVAVGKS